MKVSGSIWTAMMLLCLPLTLMANTKQTVTQVTTAVTLSEDVDYIISSETPFGDSGSIDITNTDHAVLIFSKVKPSKVPALLSHVKIKGTKATNNVNCQVRIYNIGAIVLPYASDIKPLTVYSEKNFSGEAVNDFGLENSGGFMNTLSKEKLNNRISSFKLKRGYMVTFSTLPRGRGYSRCFIAANNDLEIAELPAVLSGRISSYRIFKWNYNSKSGLANDTRSESCSKLNVTSCYSFGLGEDRGADTECVPHHIYEDWPSASACGSVTYSPHMKTNNEPGNSADDHPQSVDDILANWENLMATGMRLCSPSSHDGSLNHLRAFMDSIDARGWRCDILDLHCYWPEGSFNNIKGWVDSYHRPVWISEWVWGASWNNNGIFGVAQGTYRDNPTPSQLAQNKTAVQNICARLNSWDYVERYFYWNSEANCSKLYYNGKLTPAGEYYASMNTGVGHNGKYDFVPTTPRQYGLSKFSFTVADGKATVRWHDDNGEYNQLMELQRKVVGGQWEVLANIEIRETAANYVYNDENAPEGARYRVHIIDLNGVDHFTSDDLDVGDAVKDADGNTRYAGGDLVGNGDFNMGAAGWLAGNGTAISQPYFQVVPVGGHGGGAYLQAYGSGNADHSASVKKVVDIQPNKDYVFTVACSNGGNYIKASLTADGKTETKAVATAKNTSEWQKQTFVFNSGDYSQLILSFRQLNAKAQLDKIELRQLFATREEAVADGVERIRKSTGLLHEYNTDLKELNDELDSRMNAISTSDENALQAAQLAVDDMLQAIADRMTIDSLMNAAKAVCDMDFKGREELIQAMTAAENAKTSAEIIGSRQLLQNTLEEFYSMTDAATQPTQPHFASATGWEVKVGTYKGGDQRTNTVRGKTCWNAWWSGLNASTGKSNTMEVRQKLNDLEEGLYALECKATTEHYCLSDQHGYITASETAVSPALSANYFDLPTVGNIWETLTTTPVYVEEGGSVTIGFVSSKSGAVDNAWHSVGNASSTGDKREGWWCATDFVLKFHPLKKMSLTPGEWSTICLPYAYNQPKGMRCYRIAGILADHSKICIEEADEIQAGEPCIYIADQQDIVFYEYGEKVNSPIDYAETNNLRGFFKTTAKAPKGSYVLRDGTWYQVTNDRPAIDSFTAIIYKIDGVTELASWDGLTMPINDDLNGIQQVNNANDGDDAQEKYTLSGQRTHSPHGIYIEVKNNKARKVIKKQ